MPQDSAHVAGEFDHHAVLDELEASLARVDVYLKYGVKTLLAVARDVKASATGRNAAAIPRSISENSKAESEPYPLCHALVASTLQKVWHRQRRFSYLKSEVDLKEIIDWLPTPFTTKLPPSASDPKKLEFVGSLASKAFGALNPLTAAQVFRALLQRGEEATITPQGILGLFSVIWALGRRHGESAAAGAALEPWNPTATITAKCVFAITALTRTSRIRSKLFTRMGKALATLEQTKKAKRVIDRWQFCLAADRLASCIHEFAEITSWPKPLHAAADKILETVAPLTSTTSSTTYKHAHAAIKTGVEAALMVWRTELETCLAGVDPLLNVLLPKIEGLLNQDGYRKTLHPFCRQFRLDGDRAYWADQKRAAAAARNLCKTVLSSLRKATNPAARGSLKKFLDRVASSYENTARLLDEALRPAGRWCQIIVRDQIAHASAGNDTDFDAAELVSATAVCGLWPSFSQLETRDAIQKSRAGSRPDGSWTRGQPIYLFERVLGAWPSTPDIIWMLCTALDNYPDTTDVDDILIRFVDWIERTLNVVRLVSAQGQSIELRGWSSELYRDERTIDLWTTAVTVNALLEIRDILERRALQLCEKRFSVERILGDLDDVLPVDLGAEHGARLHRRMLNVIRRARDPAGGGEYSFVFHGPPGSSKTLLGNALAREMWDPRLREDDVRLIRITPADFTRQGNDRLDAEARFIFRLLARTRRVTILFDEIDDLLRERLTKSEPTYFKLVVPAMLNRLQDLRDAASQQEICFVLGTNFIDRIDPALIRPGRMDDAIPVPYPDAFSRVAIFEAVFEKEKKTKKRAVTTSVLAAIEESAGLPYVVVKRIAERANPVPRQEDKVHDVEQHYDDKSRWARRNAQLSNECLHVMAALRSDETSNEGSVSKLAMAIGVKLDGMLTEFSEIWKREGRSKTGTLDKLRTP